MTPKEEAQVRCHGLTTSNLSAEAAYEKHFSPTARSEWKGKLSLDEVKEVFSWTTPPWKKVRKEVAEEKRLAMLKSQLPREIAGFRLNHPELSERQVHIKMKQSPLFKALWPKLSSKEFHDAFVEAEKDLKVLQSSPAV